MSKSRHISHQTLMHLDALVNWWISVKTRNLLLALFFLAFRYDIQPVKSAHTQILILYLSFLHAAVEPGVCKLLDSWKNLALPNFFYFPKNIFLVPKEFTRTRFYCTRMEESKSVTGWAVFLYPLKIHHNKRKDFRTWWLHPLQLVFFHHCKVSKVEYLMGFKTFLSTKFRINLRNGVENGNAWKITLSDVWKCIPSANNL